MQTSPYGKKHHKSPYTRKTIQSQPSIYEFDNQPTDQYYEKLYHQTYDTQQNNLNNNEQLFMRSYCGSEQKNLTTPSQKQKKNMSKNRVIPKTPMKQSFQSDRNRSKSARSRLKTETTQIKNSPTPTTSLKPRYSIHHQDKLKVYVKFKPPIKNSSISKNVQYISQKQIEIERQTNNKIYSFDHVFHHQVSSQEVFNNSCKDLINSVTNDGKNGLVFVYGHTGTGKTYTMGLLDFVNENSRGIVPESLKYIFGLPLQSISFSFTQIYMDQVYDMLDFEGDKKMVIRQSQKNKEPYVQNLINISLNSLQEAYQLINIGLQKRRVAEQRINKRSSRGHGIISLNILCGNKWSKICFVDLAGSQRIKQSDSTGVKLNEAVHINSSLSALQTLLMNINQKSVRMYRGNKLTRLLQPFIQSGKIRLIVTSNYENIQPIQFAKRCKGIKFMERQIVQQQQITRLKHKKQSSNSNQPSKQLKQMKTRVQKLESQNKNLFYCLSNLLGVFTKIKAHISQLLENQNIHSNFSLTDSLSIKNQSLELKTNNKINQMQKKQQQIINKNNTILSQKTQINLQQIMGMIKQPGQFVNKMHEIGMEIFNNSKKLATLSQYRNIYKKQVFISQLKTNLLENKNQQFQNAINHLLKSQPMHSQSKLTKQLKDIGIVIQKHGLTHKSKTTNKTTSQNQTNSMRKKQPVDDKNDKNYKNDKNDKNNVTPRKKSRIDIQNSPLNRQELVPITKPSKRSEIWIQDI